MPDAGAAPHGPLYAVAIIGAGFAGLCMGKKLLDAGERNFIILERAGEVGGTWRDNTYPGCACDVPAHLYSYSFRPNPRWSRAFAQQPEIQAYILQCTEEFGLRPHIRFNTNVERLAFDERRGFWRIVDHTGREIAARVVVGAQGPLSRPAWPDIPGMDDFRGAAFHSSRWDHAFDFVGKRVAVIGTGASAIQLTPEIAPKVAHLDLYQRTPPWVVPKPDKAFSNGLKNLFAKAPWLHEAYRRLVYARLEWRAFGFTQYPELLRFLERFAVRHLEAQVPDPALRARLKPDYALGCKRILISQNYYPALCRENVSLVTDGIAEILPGGIRAKDGTERPADCIVYATGFKATEPLAELEVTGLGGRSLAREWAQDGPEAYYGLTVAGYPNFFMLVGPNTGLGHNSIIYMIESQVAYVIDALRLLRAEGADWMDVKPGVQDRFNAGVQARIRKTVWQSGCHSWYQTASGKNVTLWPGYTFEYRAKTRRAHAADYAFARAPAKATA